MNNEKKILTNQIRFEKFTIFDILRYSFKDNSKLYDDVAYYFDYRKRKIQDKYCLENDFFFNEDSLNIQNPFRRFEKERYRGREQKTNFLNDFEGFLRLQQRNQNHPILGKYTINSSDQPRHPDIRIVKQRDGKTLVIDDNTNREIKFGNANTSDLNLKVAPSFEQYLQEKKLNNELQSTYKDLDKLVKETLVPEIRKSNKTLKTSIGKGIFRQIRDKEMGF